MDGDHPFACRVEWNLVFTGIFFLEFTQNDAGFRCCHDDRSFCGVSDEMVTIAASITDRFEVGIVVEHAYPQGCGECRVFTYVNFVPLVEKITRRRITSTGDFKILIINPDAGDGHFVLRESAGLIGANHCCRTERLNRGEFADERVAPHHFAHTHRQADGHYGWQTFRYGGDGQADRDHKSIHQGFY